VRKKLKQLNLGLRNMEYLNLSSPGFEAGPRLDWLRGVLDGHRNIVVITGAGISVSAGIPDFRSETGLFRSLGKDHKLKSFGKGVFDASVYADGESTSSFHNMVRSLSRQMTNAQPTAFHRLLATLAKIGRLLRL